MGSVEKAKWILQADSSLGRGPWKPLTLPPPAGGQEILVERGIDDSLLSRIQEDPEALGIYAVSGPPASGKTVFGQELRVGFEREGHSIVVVVALESLYWTEKGAWDGSGFRWPPSRSNIKEVFFKAIADQLVGRGLIEEPERFQTWLSAQSKRLVVIVDNAEWCRLDPQGEEWSQALEELSQSGNVLLVLAGRQLPELSSRAARGEWEERRYLWGFSPFELRRLLNKVGVPGERQDRMAKMLYEGLGSNPYAVTQLVLRRQFDEEKAFSSEQFGEVLNEVYFYMVRYLALRYPQRLPEVLDFLDLSALLVFPTLRGMVELWPESKDEGRKMSLAKADELIKFFSKAGLAYWSYSVGSIVIPRSVAVIINSRLRLLRPDRYWRWQREALDYYNRLIQTGSVYSDLVTFLGWLRHRGNLLREEQSGQPWREGLVKEALEKFVTLVAHRSPEAGWQSLQRLIHFLGGGSEENREDSSLQNIVDRIVDGQLAEGLRAIEDGWA